MLIVIEGCVGAGKTTVAKGLAAYRGSEVLLEAFEINPFLKAFYENPVENAIETEFAFLLVHFHQLKRHAVQTARAEVIADFHIAKDLLYADLNLQPRAKELFRELYEICSERIERPVMMICLSASTDLLLKRIRRRKREFEQEIDPSYYAGVNAAYEKFFESYSGSKLRISMDDWDFVENPTLFDRLSIIIDEKVKMP